MGTKRSAMFDIMRANLSSSIMFRGPNQRSCGG
jgi:hypothetical protein